MIAAASVAEWMMRGVRNTINSVRVTVSFVLRGQCWRYERGNCAQVYRARTGIRKHDGRDVLSVFSLFGTWTCKGIDLGLLVIGAHRNPETNTFFFGEDELSALEDVLGQFIGYFCAALRSLPDQAHQTEPLSITVLQEA